MGMRWVEMQPLAADECDAEVCRLSSQRAMQGVTLAELDARHGITAMREEGYGMWVFRDHRGGIWHLRLVDGQLRGTVRGDKPGASRARPVACHR